MKSKALLESISMQKIATAQENYHGAGKLPWYRKITTALLAFLLQKFTVLLLALRR
ncbi:MAG TPA: hypothetical protein IAC95_03975 [Candidatus Fimimonas gallinarum]|uniref:Uncharacterized protein n=1 Tax=Candidatus Fimimonas gallinarum TaxID=2840821 RepID=A0A9D1E440_9BACT|nr:hypothetical protein [Candidatus Fimimonas gallinarum]